MINRRGFLLSLRIAGWSLVLLLLKGVRVLAAAARTEIPLSQLTEPWSFAEFEFTKQIKTHRGPKLSTFPGYLIRLPQQSAKPADAKQGLYAVSRICPHEGCPIKLYKQRSEVPYPLQMGEFDHPMLVCTCHQSVFDPAEGGKVLGGPAPRPPWVFDFSVEKGRIVIKDVEPSGEKWG